MYPEIDGLDVDPAGGREGGRRDAPRAARRGRWPTRPTFRRAAPELQAEQVDRLAELLPLPQLRLPFLFDADLGPDELDVLADAPAGRHRPMVDPAAVGATGRDDAEVAHR